MGQKSLLRRMIINLFIFSSLVFKLYQLPVGATWPGMSGSTTTIFKEHLDDTFDEDDSWKALLAAKAVIVIATVM